MVLNEAPLGRISYEYRRRATGQVFQPRQAHFKDKFWDVLDLQIEIENGMQSSSTVVPCKVGVAVASRVFDAAKAIREVGSIFRGLKLRPQIGIVIQGVWAPVALCCVQVN